MGLAAKGGPVPGGSRGMGRAIALGFAREGADVAVNYRSHEAEALSAVKEIQALGRRAIAVKADVGRGGEVAAMVDRVIQALGRIDILVNNAGIMKRTPLLEISEAEWEAILATNLQGCFLVTQAVAREMVKRRSGVIINMSSIGQQVAARNMTHYNTSKGGIAQLTRQAALELVDR